MTMQDEIIYMFYSLLVDLRLISLVDGRGCGLADVNRGSPLPVTIDDSSFRL
jgi:hypothetical protein